MAVKKRVVFRCVFVCIVLFCSFNINRGFHPVNNFGIKHGLQTVKGLIMGLPDNANRTGTEVSSDNLSEHGTWLYLVAYHRTGSTFAASIFDAYPNSFYIYEPLFYVTLVGHSLRFFNGSTITVTEENKHQLVMDTLINLARCDLVNINTQVFYDQNRFIFNPVFRKFHKCLVEELNHLKSNFFSGNESDYTPADLKYLTTINKNAYYVSELFFKKENLHQKNISTQTQTALSNVEKLCTEPVRSACLNADLKVFKFIRVAVEDLEELVPKFPRLKVVHLIRDPRANALSQKTLIKGSLETISAEYCSKLSRNVDAIQRLDRLYPNRTHLLRYENLSTDPLLETEKVLDFLGLGLTEKVREYLKTVALGDSGKTKNNCHGPGHLRYCVRKGNASEIAYSWRLKITENELKSIQANCREAMQKLGIQPLTYQELGRQ